MHLVLRYYHGMKNLTLHTIDLHGTYTMTYLNRDGHGAIYENGKCVMDKLRPFRTGDWISVCIENDWISFYNNGNLVCSKDLKENMLCNKDLILFSLVDYDHDAIFIEQSHSKNGLIG
eukprot:849239_1